MPEAGVLPEAEKFYSETLRRLTESGVPFMVGGAWSMREYADLYRHTKDIDVFCKAGDYQTLLGCLGDAGYETCITNAEWLAKAWRGEYFVDIIFNSDNGMCPVDGTWFDYAPTIELLGCSVRLVPAEEEIWCKAYVQDRFRFDGADVAHIIRKMGRQLDWRRLLNRMETHWELLLAHLLMFRFIYPSERDAVPQWLMEELLRRAQQQSELPTPQDPICRGPLLSRTEYEVDIAEWAYRWGYKHT